MKKGKIFSFGVYRLTLKRLLLPFTVFTVLLGIALFFLLLLTQISTQRYVFSSLEELIEQLSRHLGLLVPGTVLFPILAFPQIRKRRDADYFDSLPLSRTAVFSGCALGAATYALLAVFLLFSLFFSGFGYNLWNRADASLSKKLSLLAPAIGTLFIQVLFYSSAATLARVLCGRTLKALAATLISLPIVRGILALILVLFKPFLYDAPRPLLGFLSPRFCLAMPILSSFEDCPLLGAAISAGDVGEYENYYLLPFGVRFAYYLIFSIALFVLAALAYRKRRSECLKKDLFKKACTPLLPTLLLALPCALLFAKLTVAYGITDRYTGIGWLFSQVKPLYLTLFVSVTFVLFLLIASECKIKRILKLVSAALPVLLFAITLCLSFKAVYFYHQIEIDEEQISSVTFDASFGSIQYFYQDYLRLEVTESDDPSVLAGVAEGILINLKNSYHVRPVTLTLKNGLKVRRLTTTHQIVSAVREDEGKLIAPPDFENAEQISIQITSGISIPIKKELARRYFECYNGYDVKEQKAAHKAYDSQKPGLTVFASIPCKSSSTDYDGHHGHIEDADSLKTIHRSFRFDPPGKEAEEILYDILYESIKEIAPPDLSKVIEHTEYFLKVQDSPIANEYRNSFRFSLDLYTAKGVIEREFRPSNKDYPIADTLELVKLIQNQRAPAGTEQKERLVFVKISFYQEFPLKYNLYKTFPLYLTPDGYAALPNATPYD